MVPGNTSTSPVRIVGIGSALGADQIGWLAANQLETTGFKERYPANLVEVSICRSPVLLTTQCSSAQMLILLDAYYAADPAGSVRLFTIEELDTVHRPASSHALDIRQALELYAALENHLLPLSIIGICVGCDASETNRQSTAAILEIAFPALVKVIDAEIKLQQADMHA